MSTTATAPISLASPRAYAAPIPCAAPVTMATLSLRRIRKSSVRVLYCTRPPVASFEASLLTSRTIHRTILKRVRDVHVSPEANRKLYYNQRSLRNRLHLRIRSRLNLVSLGQAARRLHRG